MGDFTLEPANTLIVGMTGSGKSTFAYRYLLNRQAVCRFIFDDLGRAAVRLSARPSCTAREVEEALQSGWVIVNPHRMFPGDAKQAFRWCCDWVYNASCRGPGKKLFLIDEVWQWQDGRSIPRELALCAQTGREEGIELVLATQLPHKVNDAITGQATELVCFKLQEPKALDRVTELGANPDEIAGLPLGSFVAYNRLSGGILRGKVW